MSFADERSAIEDRFRVAWGTTTPVQYENVTFSRPKTSWVRLQIFNGPGEQITLGSTNPIHRWTGLITVTIFSPEDKGSGPARTLADTASAIFRSAQFSAGPTSYVRCRTPYIDPVGVNEGWHQINLLVAYQRDEMFI